MGSFAALRMTGNFEKGCGVGMTYLEKYREMGGKKIEEEELVRFYCPAEFFGVPKEHCQRQGSEDWVPVVVTEAVSDQCRDCWNQEYDEGDHPTQYMSKLRDVMEKDFMQALIRQMQGQPVGKQRLAARIAVAIMESEMAFTGYPRTTDGNRIKKVLTQVLHRYRVSTEDGQRLFRELAERYREL